MSEIVLRKIKIALSFFTFLCFVGFHTDEDMKRVFQLPRTTKLGGEQKELPLQEIIARLRTIYCGNIGLEYMHVNDRAKCTGHKRERENEREGGMEGEKVRDREREGDRGRVE